jgi:uncharacterized protein YacL
MDTERKYYKACRMKNYLKKNNGLFFFFGGSKSPSPSMKQKIKSSNLDLNKTTNKILIKALKHATIGLIAPLINGSIFLATPLQTTKIFIKTVLITNMYPLFFYTLAFKLNTKMYSVSLIKNIHSFNYFQNKQLLKQLCITKIKATCYCIAQNK